MPYALKISIFFLFALFGSTPLLSEGSADGPAEIKLSVGAPEIDGSFIKPRTIQWIVYSVDANGNKTKAGTWLDTLSVVKNQLRRKEVIQYNNQPPQVSEHWADHKTMRPILNKLTVNGQPPKTIKFSGLKITVAAPGSGGKKAFDLPFEVFDDTWYALLVAAFPLKEGAAFSYPVFDGQQSCQWVSFSVLGKEAVTSGSKTFSDCWKVKASSGALYWIDKGQDSCVIKVSIPSGAGSIEWEME